MLTSMSAIWKYKVYYVSNTSKQNHGNRNIHVAAEPKSRQQQGKQANVCANINNQFVWLNFVHLLLQSPPFNTSTDRENIFWAVFDYLYLSVIWREIERRVIARRRVRSRKPMPDRRLKMDTLFHRRTIQLRISRSIFKISKLCFAFSGQQRSLKHVPSLATLNRIEREEISLITKPHITIYYAFMEIIYLLYESLLL
jgi:hypothetical protein